MSFVDRQEAGRRLADALLDYRDKSPVVLALPRGGVPVAAEVAARLNAPLDLIIVRKIGVPAQPELAMGAVVDTTPPFVLSNDRVVTAAGVSRASFAEVRERELVEAKRRRALYLSDLPRQPLEGRTVILVDDGIATGASIRAALHAVREQKPRRVVVAVPVAPQDALPGLRREADAVICLETPSDFGAIGYYYENFSQLSDEDVIAILRRFRTDGPVPAGLSRS